MTLNEKRLLINIGRHLLRVAPFGGGDGDNALAKAIIECEIELHQPPPFPPRTRKVSHEPACDCFSCSG